LKLSYPFNSIIMVVLLFTFTFSIFIDTPAQVKIKEKVEIKPRLTSTLKGLNSTALIEHYPCGPFIYNDDYYNPWQVVWVGSSYPLDPGQQAFNYQGNTLMVNGQEYEYGASGNQKIEIIKTGECPGPINQNMGSLIDAPTYWDIVGEGDYMVLQGIPNRIPSGYVRYTVRFIKEGDVTIRYTNLLTGVIINYNTTVVEPDFYLEYSGLDILPHGEEENDFDVAARPIQCTNAWQDTTGGVIHGFWNGGGFPEDVKFNVSIEEGTEYAKLIRETFDGFAYLRDTSASLSGLDNTNYELFLAACGEEPKDTATVKLRYSTTDNSIAAIDKVIKIVKNSTYPIKVNIEPAELMPGDTALITLERRVSTFPIHDPFNVQYEPFETNQLFDINIEEGKNFGTIFSVEKNDTSDEFKQVTDGLYFIANDTINNENKEISIRVKTILYYFDGVLASSEKKTPVSVSKNKGKNSTAIIFVPPTSEEIFGIGKVSIGEDVNEIMLGETKYFQAKYPDPTTNELVIEEVEVDENGLPALDGGLAQNVWGDNPVIIINDSDTSGQRNGVYWETQKPMPNGENLTDGLIRVIGRYWHQDSSYVVKLKAGRNNDSAEVKIKVIAPSMLGTTNNTAMNIDNEEYNLDSLVIYYGGLYGIAPQLIKSLMHHESNFHPGYRYEPILDMRYQNTQEILAVMQANAYWISEPNNIGEPAPPENVSNLRDGALNQIQYPNSVQTIWEYFDDHRNLYENFLVRIFDETYPEFIDSIEANYRDLNITVSDEIIEQEARDSLWYHVRYNYHGGFENHIAQTRIIASYGKLQLVYYNGITEASRGYPNDFQTTPISERHNPPERLNNTEHYYFSFALRHLIAKFWSPNRWNFYQEGNWTEGYERTWRKVLNNYNGNLSGYGSGGCTQRVDDYGSVIMCWYNQLYYAIN